VPIRGSEVRKMAVLLCFVKSACVSDPDLPLLTLKHKKSHFSQATSNGTKGCFAYFFSLGKK
jgi:hypothetical protein